MIEANIKGKTELVAKTNGIRTALQQGRDDFINNHIIREIRIQGKLIRNIHREVYSARENEAYDRTYALLDSVTMKRTENGIMIYMSGDQLREASDTAFSWTTGYAPEAKGVDYSWYVEEGHTYRNTAGHPYGSDYAVDETIGPRRFMGITWEELQAEIDVSRILRPLFGMWSS